MKLTDKELGMDRSISRRDFPNGAASAAAVTAMSGGSLASINVAVDRAYRAIAEVV